MYVLVADRQTGKTTRLVSWLLDGEQRANYPGWSRVIVCASYDRVRFVTGVIAQRTQKEWNRLQTDAGHPRYRQLADIRKAVWSLDELHRNSFGGRMEVFDYALDDAEEFLAMVLRVHKAPVAITMNGQAWT